MESLVLKKYPVTSVSREFPYRCRFRIQSGALKESMRRHGLISPVIVAENPGNAPVLVAGHARFQAALELGWKEIPAFAAGGLTQIRDGYIFSLLSNWNQAWNDLDRIFAVRRALDLGFCEKEMMEEILPALGLNPEKRWLDEAVEIMSLDSAVLDAVADGKMPFRGIRSLSVFSPDDQRIFVQRLTEQVSWTSNQLIRIAEWLFDLIRSRKMTMNAFLESSGIKEVMKRTDWNPRQKAELLYQTVREMRFPEQTEREAQFISAAERLIQEARQEKSDLTVEAPPFFEAEGLILKARLRDPEALERVLQVIQKKRNLFNSLFDIVL